MDTSCDTLSAVRPWQQGNRQDAALFYVVDHKNKPVDAAGTWTGVIAPPFGEPRPLVATPTPEPAVAANAISIAFTADDDADAGDNTLQLTQTPPAGQARPLRAVVLRILPRLAAPD